MWKLKKETCDLLVNVDGKIAETYRYFKEFLTQNRHALNIIAELEQTYYGGRAFTMKSVEIKYGEILASTQQLIDALNGISKGKYTELSDACIRIDQQTAFFFIQSRHLGLVAAETAAKAMQPVFPDHPMLLSEGKTATIYQGRVPELSDRIKPMKSFIYENPVHRWMKAVLDNISPLNLIDPKHPSFSPEGCRTFHDIIRFAHENAMKEMFSLSGQDKKDATAVKLTANFPLSLYCIDLDGGLKPGLTTCETITPYDFESVPMKAMWRGFTHPGISWSGTVNFGFGNLMTLMASSATSEIGGGMPGGDSFAVLSREYLNLSAKFGYHYANVDTFCGEDVNHNYIALQFAGGAGAYYGRTMRIHFLSEVLGRLGFSVVATGDILEANLIPMLWFRSMSNRFPEVSTGPAAWCSG